MVLCSKIDLNSNLQVRCRCTKLNSHEKAPCTHEQLYTGVVPDVCARTAGKVQILRAPDGLLVLSRNILALAEVPARYERPFSEDPLEDVLGGLSWEYILYQDGQVGRRTPRSPVISWTHTGVMKQTFYRVLSILKAFGMLWLPNQSCFILTWFRRKTITFLQCSTYLF